MEVRAFLALVVPVLIVFYLAFLLFIRPPRKVLLASLLGGVIMAIINLLVDLAAYYAHWWHYTLKELILHLPLPFYISPLLVFGSLAYLLIWRFWFGKRRWFSLSLLVAVPVFCIIRDISGGILNTGYQVWENSAVATVVTVMMWLIAFFAGFWLFWRIAASIPPHIDAEVEEPRRREQRSSELLDEVQNHAQ